jgi:hypothetical protein
MPVQVQKMGQKAGPNAAFGLNEMEDAAFLTGAGVFTVDQGLSAQGRKGPGVLSATLSQPLSGQSAQHLPQQLTSQVQTLVKPQEEIGWCRRSGDSAGVFGKEGLQNEAVQRVKGAGPDGCDQRLNVVEKKMANPEGPWLQRGELSPPTCQRPAARESQGRRGGHAVLPSLS